jgi:cytochrome P450
MSIPIHDIEPIEPAGPVGGGALSAEFPRLSDPGTFFSSVPHAEFARRRREAPVSWVDETTLWRHGVRGRVPMRGSGYWAVTRHATVTAALRDVRAFSSEARGAFLVDPASRADLERMRQLLINMDAPRHQKYRRVLSEAFTPVAVRRLAEGIRLHARALVRRCLERQEFDIVSDLAAELPLLVLADLFGMPREDRGLLLRWSNNLVGFDDPDYGDGDIEIYKGTFVESFAYVATLAAAKRANPTDDLVGRLVSSEVDGQRLTESEIGHLWIMLLVAGNESTRHLLSGSLLALAEHPGDRDRLAADPGLVAPAVEELLRWVSPIMLFRRTATRDVELDGQRIREGDKVALYFISANRDEEVFASPDRLDLARAPNPHVAFGAGPHFCLGAHLARMEAAALLEALGRDLSRLELRGPVTRLRSNFMNGIKSMPACLSTAPRV